MLDIPINAKVHCTDDNACGRTTYVVLNPVTEKMTHVVVKRGIWPHDERLVPIELVTASTEDTIQLDCTKHQLAQMDSFIQTDFIESPVDQYLTEPYVLGWPYHFSETHRYPIEHEHVPVGELAVRRGARVEATDGYAGRVDGFMVNETSEHITHLVLHEGHLWGQKDVTVPVSEIARIEEDIVHLKLTKAALEDLQTVPATSK